MATLYAFIDTSLGKFKIYDRGDDWEVSGPNGFEQWFSQWQKDKQGSFEDVVTRLPKGTVHILQGRD